ncbi:class I SAM-dependent methyltransferase [Brevibacterium jeotgali]|uniref:Methyltransferase domain-containing protein n=1 Tax=Brevibacterium jeotgali TaxID=1262550 RepID=A0A2H1L8Q3_9MICO|nr:class I SAM-dependent methyltransferase [Brevibacterium jeotgali]TWC03242.1 methyltransferase family protein [Brevibacterium jeotgali]SMY13266.1 Methyltransferase domain-containing protein [Brevibacterium jeotgali]
MDEVTQAYRTKAVGLAGMLGTVVSPRDPGRSVVEPWAETVSGRILDVGAGTGRWTGHLAALGYDVEGLEPVDQFVELARRAHPAVPFRHGSLADLVGSAERWSGILAWYSLIHLDPDQLPPALATLRSVLDDDGSLLLSFFSGPRFEAFQHPATTAYRWPITAMARALESAGYEVTDQQQHPRHPHAAITARTRPSSS